MYVLVLNMGNWENIIEHKRTIRKPRIKSGNVWDRDNDYLSVSFNDRINYVVEIFTFMSTISALAKTELFTKHEAENKLKEEFMVLVKTSCIVTMKQWLVSFLTGVKWRGCPGLHLTLGLFQLCRQYNVTNSFFSFIQWRTYQLPR